MNSPNIIVLNARVLFLFGCFPLFLCFSFFFFYTVVSLLNFCFCVKRDLAFRVTFVYHVRSEILLERHKNIVLGPGQSLEKGQWKLGTFASFLGQPILSINLTLPDESLYACSFFFSRAGKLADRFISNATPRFIFCDTTEKMLPISPLFTEPLLRQQAETFKYNSRVQEKERYFTWSFMVFPKSLTSFMLIAFFPPFSFPFFLFFFLNKHFLQRQKQQVRINRTATMAMAIKAQGGTGREKETHKKKVVIR